MSIKKKVKLNKNDKKHLNKNIGINVPFLKNPFVFLILFFIIAIIYGGSINNNIVHLDDDMMFDNLKLLQSTSYSIFHESYTRDAMVGIGGDLYRPVQTFSLIVLYSIAKDNLVYFHIFQIFLHIIAGFLIYLLLTSFSLNKYKSLILSILYSVHPLFVSLPSFIPAVGDQLLVIFGLCSFIFFINYLNSNNIYSLLLHILSFLLAVFTKETALFFPVIYSIYFFIFSNKSKYLKMAVPLIFWVSIPLFYMLLRQHFVSPSVTASHNVLNIENVTRNIIYNMPSMFEFISKFFFPYKLSFLSSYSTLRLFIGIAFIIFFVVLTLLKKIEFKYFIFAVLWYGILVFPPMLYHNPVFDYGEHRGFLPLISQLFLIASIKTKYNFNWLIYLLIVVFGAMSFVRKNDFKDPISFYSAIIDNEAVPIAYLNRGAYIHKYKKDINKVLNDYNKAIEVKSNYATALYNRAILKSEDLKDIEGAFADLDAAIIAKPNYADAYYHRGYMKLTSLNDITGAVADIDSAIILNPSYVLAYNNRGILRLSYLNDTIGSFNDFDKSISIQAISNPTPYFYRGLHYYRENDFAKSCADWREAEKQGYKQATEFLRTKCQ